MFCLNHWLCDIKTVKRRGISIVEAVIVMAVLAVVLWGIMTTIASSTELHTTAKAHINARIFANSWFEVFESFDPRTLENQTDMITAFDNVAAFLDSASSKNYPNYVINGQRLRVDGSWGTGWEPVNGVRTVTLQISVTDRSAPFEIVRSINARSEETASDDKPVRE